MIKEEGDKGYPGCANDQPVEKAASDMEALIAASHPEKLRRSERAFLRVPIQVQGTNEAGRPFTEQTVTLVINRDGARIGLKASVQPNDQITVTNLQNRLSCPFRVVARVLHALGELPEWGIECLRPEMNLWGISFPEGAHDKPSKRVVDESVDALLECLTCRTREFAHLTLEEYRQLSSTSRLNRPCPECRRSTVWTFGFVETEEEDWSPALPDRGKPGIERRRAKRLALKLPVQIRLEDGSKHWARTEDLSKTGVCFSMSKELHEGERVRLAVGCSEGSEPSEIEARVVWRREFESGKSFLYGVKLD